MYSFNYTYQLKKGNSSDENYKNETVLKAKFLFGKETSPLKRKEVKERCRTAIKKIKDANGISYTDIGKLNKYLEENERTSISEIDSPFGKKYFRHKTIFWITPLLFGLGFRLREVAMGHLPLEDMINLEALNHFVLTGEYPLQKPKEKVLLEQQA